MIRKHEIVLWLLNRIWDGDAESELIALLS
jgi:hypothetical protein